MTTRPNLHVSIDLETLSTSPAAVILSIGAVAFCEDTGRTASFATVVSVDSQDDRQIDASTLRWWEQQSAEARIVLDLAKEADAPPLRHALDLFTDWIGSFGATHDVHVWGNGSDFDVAILAHAYKSFSPFVPWHFKKARDMRTLYDVTSRFGLDIRSYTPRVGTHHNALDDAQYQANIIHESLRQIGLIARFIRDEQPDLWQAYLARESQPQLAPEASA